MRKSLKSRSGSRRRARWLDEVRRLDVAAYAAIAATRTPILDVAFRRLSRAANHSKLWVAASAIMAMLGGARERRAAAGGLTSVALSSVVVNLLLKPLGHRRRPSRARYGVPLARHVAMPHSTSWPSGHAASAFAFATAAGAASPPAAAPLTTLAALVAYSRVHTGVHYPLDVIAGAVTGVTAAPVGAAAAERLRRWGDDWPVATNGALRFGQRAHPHGASGAARSSDPPTKREDA